MNMSVAIVMGLLGAGTIQGVRMKWLSEPEDPAGKRPQWRITKETVVDFLVLMLFISIANRQAKGVGELIIAAALVVTLAAISLVDYHKMVIPDEGVAVVFLLAAGAMALQDETTFLSGLMGAAAAGGILLVLSFTMKGAVGLGDVKLMAGLGAFYGFWQSMALLVIAVGLSGLAGLLLMVLRKATAKTQIPFAPFTLAAVLVMFFWL